MYGSSIGNIFRITTWGESHGNGVGVVIDGCPAGLSLCEEDIQVFLDRRKPGQSKFTTARAEGDIAHIESGVFEGKTTGCPISVVVYNNDQKTKDYNDISTCFRPGHADYTYDRKYGHRDYRGGGRSSGRETIGRVIAGAIASKILSSVGINIVAYTKSIGPITINNANFDSNYILNNVLYMPDKIAFTNATSYLEDCIKKNDSAGGTIECVVSKVPIGLGDPCFEKLSANLAKAICSIGAVKGFEIGDGFAVSTSNGTNNNDTFSINEDNNIVKDTNHSGGVLGGISDGSDIIIRAAIKPTPSISSEQKTVTKNGQIKKLIVKGRHDPIIVPRAVVVVESMVAITLVDALLANMTSTMSSVTEFYK